MIDGYTKIEPLSDHLNVTGNALSIGLAKTLPVTDKLYGRAAEMKALTDAFERICCGAAEFIAVSGSVGSGKSALVHQFFCEQAAGGARFLAGKCEQFQCNIPYASIVQALQVFVRQLLTEESQHIAIWRERFNQVLGVNAQLMIEIIPDLEFIIGPQPQVPSLTPQKAQIRFQYVFKNLVLSLADSKHPLVLFLDDLQWMDSATRNILHHIAIDNQTEYLLMIGAYRNVDTTIDSLLGSDIQQAGCTVHSVELKPLMVPDVADMLADMLIQEPRQVRPLAEVCFNKTLGNPLFLNRFLHVLHEQEFIYFDDQKQCWVWKLQDIRNRAIPDSFVDLLVGNFSGLSTTTQQLLKEAACIGHTFELQLVQAVNQSHEAETVQMLEEAIQRGLIVDINRGRWKGARDRCYAFYHDKIQQAVYSLIDAKDRAAIHYRIGQAMLQRALAANRLDEQAFGVIYHLRYANQIISDTEQQNLFIRLNLQAAQKAKKAAAYGPALQYAVTAMNLFGHNHWDADGDLAYQIYKERVELEFLNGKFNEAEKLAQQVLQHTQSNLAQAEIYNLLILQYTLQNKLQQAVDAGRKALQLLGEKLPLHVTKRAIQRELEQLSDQMNGQDLFAIQRVSLSMQPLKKTAINILLDLIAPLMVIDINLLAYIQVRTIREALQHGYFPEATVFFAGLGVIIGPVYGEYTLGYQLNLFALKMAERVDDLPFKTVICSAAANYSGPWVKHLRILESINTEGYLAGIKTGQVDDAGLILAHKVCNDFYMGKPLQGILAQIDEYLPFMVKTQNSVAMEILLGFRLRIANLLGLTPEQSACDDRDLDEEHDMNNCPIHYALAYHYLFKGETLYLFGRMEQAYQYIGKAKQWTNGLVGLFANGELLFYESLILAKLCSQSTEVPLQREHIAANLKQIKSWKDHCPENFSHKYELIAAELARIDGQWLEAINMYDQAVRDAHEHQFLQDEAIANELAAEFWSTLGKKNFVRLYIGQAYDCYRQWGAKYKLNHLYQTYRDCLEMEQAAIAVQPTQSQEVDMTALIKSSRAIAEETLLESLLGKMVTVLIENSGAQKCCVILNDHQQFIVAAIGVIGENQIIATFLPSKLLEETTELSQAIVRYVARTRQPVVVHDAAREGLFTRDEYVRHNQIQSVLCVPILYQGTLKGILYLENNRAHHIFTSTKMEILQLLSSQIAISLENAQLRQHTKLLPATEMMGSVLAPTDDGNERQHTINQSWRQELERLFYCSDKNGKQMLALRAEFREALPHMFVSCFNGFDVFIIGQTVEQVHWRTLKAKELFALLVYQQGLPVSKEKIIDRLWPELPMKKANELFRTNFYYARKELKNCNLETAITHDQTGYSLSLEEISCDATLFAQGLAGKTGILSSEEAERVEQYTALYRGDYLDEPGWEWAEPGRCHYREVAIASLVRLTEYFQVIHRFDKLVYYLGKLVEYDPYAVQANEQLIKAYAALDRMNDAKRQYQQYRRSLQDDLGIVPSKTLQDILADG